MGYSPWGYKESDMTERLSTAQHNEVLGRAEASVKALPSKSNSELMGQMMPFPEPPQMENHSWAHRQKI